MVLRKARRPGMWLNTSSKTDVSSGALGHLKDSLEPSSLSKWASLSFSTLFCGQNGGLCGHPKGAVESRHRGQGSNPDYRAQRALNTGLFWRDRKPRLPGTRPPTSGSCPGLLMGVLLTPLSDWDSSPDSVGSTEQGTKLSSWPGLAPHRQLRNRVEGRVRSLACDWGI